MANAPFVVPNQTFSPMLFMDVISVVGILVCFMPICFFDAI
jgi:hypothetical protein